MRRTLVLAGSAAIAVMVFYSHSLVYLSRRSRLRCKPATILDIKLGGVDCLRALPVIANETIRSPEGQAEGARALFSALVVLDLILFPQAIANLFANVLGG